ncbi:galectin-2-like isoform X2 [Protopterus annectens]|uniref:galectin-2-like isoform X2 n=1 Tax=Protopterus annectens TaxID=7888 RepID=UPI001CF9609F|nr:galectin-2-like isoform X2 [Protopterus annectens]
MTDKFEIVNIDIKPGTSLTFKGVPGSENRFAINLGKDSNNLALHFNPRFDENVVVCNSLHGGSWQSEQRERRMNFARSAVAKFSVHFRGDAFVVKMPDGSQIVFPNRHGYNSINYIAVRGGFKLTSFKFE